MKPNTYSDALYASRLIQELENTHAPPVWFLMVYTLLGLAIGGFWWWVAVLLSG